MCSQTQSTSTLLVQFSLQLLQLDGVRRSSILTLLRYQLVERDMNTFLVYWAPERGTRGHKYRYKGRKKGNTGSETEARLRDTLKRNDLLTQSPVVSWGETATRTLFSFIWEQYSPDCLLCDPPALSRCTVNQSQLE